MLPNRFSAPSALLYRVARLPDPWQFPDWSLAKQGGTFGGRFDDPKGRYRVLYAASKRLGCFLETLAYYRCDPTLGRELEQIEGPDDFLPPSTVPKEWLQPRCMGSTQTAGEFAVVYERWWVDYLCIKMKQLCADLDIPEFGASVLQLTTVRPLTQAISELVYAKGLNGIRYLSRHGHHVENWALFEPATLISQTFDLIAPNDPDLLEAFRIFNLKWAGG